MQLIPTHVRHAQVFRELRDASLQQIESMMVTEFFTFGEKKVHTKTDPTRGRSGRHLFTKGGTQSELIQVAHRITERSNTGKNELRCRTHIVRIRRDAHVMAKPSQRILETAKVVQLVIDYGDHSTPFVDGISACSIRVAKCKARAVALKIVSAI